MTKRCCGALTVACGLLLTMIAPASSRAQDGLFQIEGHVSDGWGLRAGVRLGERAALLTGVNAEFYERDLGFVQEHAGSWSIPLEAKLYLSEPNAGAVVPTTALGGSYGRHTRRWEPASSGGLGGLGGLGSPTGTGGLGTLGVTDQSYQSSFARAYWLLGVAWFATDAFALDLAAGPYYQYAWYDGPEGAEAVTERAWGVTWRLAVVVRP